MKNVVEWGEKLIIKIKNVKLIDKEIVKEER